MSDTEKEKDVSCFTVDGVVAEMVIEVEENQRAGCDDITNSPSKDNSCDKNKNPVNDSKDSVDATTEEEKKNQIVESNTDKEDKENSIEIIEEEQTKEENSIEIIEEEQNSKEPVEDKKPDEKTEHVVENKKCDENKEYIVEDKTCDEIDKCVVEGEKYGDSNGYVIEDKKYDEINEEEKMTNEINDKSVEDTKSKELNQKNIKNNQTSKRKRKDMEESINSKENDISDTDMPRYPDVKKRKIEVNKKEIKDTSNKVSPTKKVSKTEEQTSDSGKEPVPSKEPEKTVLSRSLRNRKTEEESEKSSEKQSALRKLPFRKNKDAPEVPDLKPKVFLWNGVGEGQGVKLGDIPEIRGRIQKAKSIRALYRILYFQWPTNGQDIIAEILKFNGFPFDASSYEYTKRQSLMKIMLDKTIFHMCELLDIRKGDKLISIKNILDFLLKPYAKNDPATDPYWQPVVILEKIKLDKYFDDPPKKEEFKSRRGRKPKDQSSKDLKEKDAKSSFVTPTRSTRSSVPKIELVVIPDSEIVTAKSKDDVKQTKTKSSVKGKTTPVKESKVISHETKKVTTASGVTKTKASLGKDEKSKAASTKDIKEKSASMKDIKEKDASKKDTKEKDASKKDTKEKDASKKDTKEKDASSSKDIKKAPKELKSKTEEIKSNVTNTLEKKKKFNKRRKKVNSISNKKLPEKKEVSNTEPKYDSDEYEIEMTIDSGPDMDEDTEMNDAKKLESKSLEKSQENTDTENQETANEISNTAVSMVSLSDSSETESAEETKLVTASKKSSKVPMKRKGKPLRHFPKISDSIQNANFSALQRLHILLFGASDKAENLKSNILSFGGFPFLEGSDEWKQKHFLLSLLAQNNLREYLNLLCIPHVNDDQPTMINKLMRFLAVPSEESLEVNKIQPIETEVVSSVLVDKSSPVAPVPKGKGETKKRVKKKKEEKISKRPRKILMSEEEARRLEANFAREQRALAREKKLIPFPPIPQKIQLPVTAPTLNMHNYVPTPKSKPPITDPDQLNALLQTVYKRRALKAAGAIISTPNKGQKTKLGDIENIKFLIVTSHLQDLEILHRLIYMLEASKARIRKNIMDFDGFGFNEDSPKYQHRMDYLNSLGYEASKRLSFLLGLCPLNTDIPQNDLNELIMYFLMSPCKSQKTVPITQMPSEEPHIIVKSTAPLHNSLLYPSFTTPVSISKNVEVTKKTSDEVTIQHSTPIPKTSQKAKKTFPSSSKMSPVKKVLLPPAQSPILGVSSLGNKSQKMTLLNSIPAVPAYSIPKSTVANPLTNLTLLNTGGVVLNAPKSPINSLVKVPVSPGSRIQVVNQNPKANVLDSATQKIPVSLSSVPVSLPNVSGQVLQNQIVMPQIANNNSIQSPQVQQSLMQSAKMLLKTPTNVSGSPQEFLVQQQTPDGQQKVYKLIRLPSNHPLVSNVGNKPPVQQTISSPPLQQQVLLNTNAPLAAGNLPPGVIIMKNTSGSPQFQNLQLLPNTPVKFLPVGTTSTPVSSVVSSSQSKTTLPPVENIESSNEKDSTLPQSANTSLDSPAESLSSSDDNPPTDEDLFTSIQEVILSSNFEDITLRNVIERVAAQYPHHDLTHRHNYMKECVKKIIIGT